MPPRGRATSLDDRAACRHVLGGGAHGDAERGGAGLCSAGGRGIDTVCPLLKAKAFVREAKSRSDYELIFRPVNLEHGGILVVGDAASGSADEVGGMNDDRSKNVHPQAAYLVFSADPELMGGGEGRMALLDYRSHRLQRVGRPSYAIDTMGPEEAADAAQLLRRFVAELRGSAVGGRDHLHRGRPDVGTRPAGLRGHEAASQRLLPRGVEHEMRSPLEKFIVEKSRHSGWYKFGADVVQIARNARALRTPQPRNPSTSFPKRMSYALQKPGDGAWKIIENKFRYGDVPDSTARSTCR